MFVKAVPHFWIQFLSHYLLLCRKRCKEVRSDSCSVMSDSLQPYGPWPARPNCPWNSLGKNTEVGSYPFSKASSQPSDWTLVSYTVGRFFTVWNHSKIEWLKETIHSIMCPKRSKLTRSPGKVASLSPMLWWLGFLVWLQLLCSSIPRAWSKVCWLLRLWTGSHVSIAWCCCY